MSHDATDIITEHFKQNQNSKTPPLKTSCNNSCVIRSTPLLVFFWVPFRLFIGSQSVKRKSATFCTLWKDSFIWPIVKKNWSKLRRGKKKHESKLIHSFVGITDPDHITEFIFFFKEKAIDADNKAIILRYKDLNNTYSIIYNSAWRKAPPWNIVNVAIKIFAMWLVILVLVCWLLLDFL